MALKNVFLLNLHQFDTDFRRYSFDDSNFGEVEDSIQDEVNVKQEIITKDDISRANSILAKYRAGKNSLNNRIVENEKWWRQRHWEVMRANDEAGNPREIEPTSAWLFNDLMAKYSDYMESYPAPNILPREKNDEAEAKMLSQIDRF